jgi:hypothetical protein
MKLTIKRPQLFHGEVAYETAKDTDNFLSPAFLIN